MDEARLLALLPPRDIFPKEMPRYPNLWLLVDEGLALRAQYPYAIRFLVRLLEQFLGLKDSFVRDVENPNLAALLRQPGEGSDFQARIAPLQPFHLPGDPGRSHTHQLHARFYVSPLIKSGKARIPLGGGLAGASPSFLIPASVHYEVTTEEPLHPYADDCPFCGITGGYAVKVDRASQDYCLKIHDPLGLELLLHGRIRGEEVAAPEGGRLKSVEDLGRFYGCEIREMEATGLEPLRMALVRLYPGPGAGFMEST